MGGILQPRPTVFAQYYKHQYDFVHHDDSDHCQAHDTEEQGTDHQRGQYEQSCGTTLWRLV